MPIIPLTTQLPDDRPLVKIVYERFQQPAAGQNMPLTVPQGYRLQMKTIAVNLVTDATVANRFLFIQLVGPNGLLLYFQDPFAITASEARSCTIAEGLPYIAHTALNMTATWPWPLNLTIEEGSTLTIGLGGIQATDLFVAAAYMALSQFVAE